MLSQYFQLHQQVDKIRASKVVEDLRISAEANAEIASVMSALIGENIKITAEAASSINDSLGESNEQLSEQTGATHRDSCGGEKGAEEIQGCEDVSSVGDGSLALSEDEFQAKENAAYNEEEASKQRLTYFIDSLAKEVVGLNKAQEELREYVGQTPYMATGITEEEKDQMRETNSVGSVESVTQRAIRESFEDESAPDDNSVGK